MYTYVSTVIVMSTGIVILTLKVNISDRFTVLSKESRRHTRPIEEML